MRLSQLYLCGLLSPVLGLASPTTPGLTQNILPDSTLGAAERSMVTPIGDATNRIDGGTLRGSLLFHSFQEFSIPEGHGAYFANPDAVNVIFSRVTGNNPSLLFGTLGMLGEADLVFLNPNGILFGPNAELDLRGAFTATTATGLVFPGGEQFSAINPEAAPLLTVNVQAPVGIVFEGTDPAAIINQGELAVTVDQSLTLLGGGLANTGSLQSPGGTITMLAAPGNYEVRLSDAGEVENWAPLAAPSSESLGLSVEALSAIANVPAEELPAAPNIFEPGTAVVSGSVDVSSNIGAGGTVAILGDRTALIDATVNASGVEGGGEIRVGGNYRGQGDLPTAARTVVDAGSTLQANALEQGNGGQLVVWSDVGTQVFGQLTASGGSVGGDGGLVEVSSAGELTFAGTVSAAAMNGMDGTLLLDPKDIRIEPTGAEVATGQLFNFNPAGLSSISGAALSAAINAANVELQANNDIVVADNITATTVGNGLTLRAGRAIAVQDDFAISLNGGDFQATINDSNADLANRDPGDARFSMADGSSITTNGGNIIIEPGNLIGEAGEVSFEGATLNAGDGNIEITGRSRENGIDVIGVAVGNTRLQTSENGSINLLGTASNGTGAGHIGLVTGGGAQIISEDGQIMLQGIGGDAEGGGNSGMRLGGTVIQSTGSGEIDIIGVAGRGSGALDGILLVSDVKVLTVDGDIRLEGTSPGGDADSSVNTGVELLNFGDVPSEIRAQGLGNIYITGIVRSDDADLPNLGASSQGIVLVGPPGINITSNVGDVVLTGLYEGIGNENNDIVLAEDNGFRLSGGTVTTNGNISTLGNDLNFTAVGAINIDDEIETGGGAAFFQAGTNLTIDGNVSTRSGELDFISTESISINGAVDTGGGEVLMQAGTDLTLFNDLSTQGLPSGDISLITGNQLQLQDSDVSSQTRGTDVGGSITVQADIVSLNNGSRITAGTFGEGDAGNISINTRQLRITGESDGELTGIGADTLFGSSGNGGDVVINASELIEVSGGRPGAFTPDPTDPFSVSEAGALLTGIISATRGFGDAGNIELNTGALRIRDGAGVTTASILPDANAGNAGDIRINAQELELQGLAGIASTTFSGGDSGDIDINATVVTLSDGGVVTADSIQSLTPNGLAGDIRIYANQVTLDNRSRISTTSSSGDGGNIFLEDIGALILRRGDGIGGIFTDGGILGEIGDGGRIFITADFIFAVPQESTDISAGAFLGTGGGIFITADYIQGIEFRDGLTPLSEITAFSQLGDSGVVDVQVNALDPTQGLEALPEEPQRPQIIEGCVADGNQQAVGFFDLGRGGRLPGPDDLMTADSVVVEWLPLALASDETSTSDTEQVSRFIAACRRDNISNIN